MSVGDTIAASASAPGTSAVGVLRISGPRAFELGAAICERWRVPVRAREALWTHFVERGARFDEGLALPFPGPASYTGEDVLELHGHGGFAHRRLLEVVLAQGARAAEPGEFTQRAFLAGKMDLAQAEAVARLIEAGSARALAAAERALGGSISQLVQQFQGRLGSLTGRVEALLDFPAEAAGAEQTLAADCAALAGELAALASGYARGRRLFTRSEVVLAGPVNAGKSTLLNALCGEERALVDAAPGTTRDLVTADVELDGLPVRLVDTAGWREAEGLEARGIALGRAAAGRAELVLWVTSVEALEPSPDPRWLAVVAQRDRRPSQRLPQGLLAVSARTGEGLAALRGEIAARLAGAGDDERLLVTERQARAFADAASAMSRAASTPALELVAEELRTASRALAAVRGVDAPASVMDEVFRQFCIGK